MSSEDAGMRLAILVGTTRQGRHSRDVAEWLLELTAGRGPSYQLVDLVDHPLPHFDEALPPMVGRYQEQHTLDWADTIRPYDGYVFVTGEYNHAPPAVLKNAIDYLYAEWADKAVAFAGYGVAGGVRAVEQLRCVVSGVAMADVQQQVALSLFTDFADMRTLTPAAQQSGVAEAMLDQLEAWAGALRHLRATRGT